MKTSAEEMFEEMGRLYTNIYNLMVGFQNATNSNSNIVVEQVNPDQTKSMVTINSFQQVMNELKRIDNNFIASTNGNGYIVNSDGSLSNIQKVSYMNAEFISNVQVSTDCIVDNVSPLRDMVFPNVKLPITIDTLIKSNIRARIYDITSGWESIETLNNANNLTTLQLDYLLSQGTVIGNWDESILELQKERVKFFGKFNVISATPLTLNNTQTIVLDKITYGGLTNISQSLVVDNIIATDNGRFIIESINNFTKTLNVKRIAGTGSIMVGIDKVAFNEILDTETNIVAVPIQPNKKLVVFLSTENTNVISFPSNGIVLDTSTFTVTSNNETLTLDEYFAKNVTNLSEYLYSIIRDTTIPMSMGIRPNKPVLTASNFKVVQINKHLTDAKSTKELETLNKEKQKVQNDIDYTQTSITSINNDIDTLKFKSLEEKQYRIAEVTDLRKKLNELNTQLLTITRNLNNNAIQFGLKSSKPKYKVVGMWEIQNPIYSPLTKAQNIIKYEVQYRYLSKNVDTVESTSYKMINSDGVEVSVTISPWNNLPTTSLTKVQNIDGSISWQTSILDSVDEININQLSISINEGESVEIRVRAVSEAGYPLSPLMSEWSDTLRQDFPESLTESALNTIVSKNDEDLRLAEFQNILQTAGIMQHISRQIRESEKTYFHNASDIASGFFSDELKIIPLDLFLQRLDNKINQVLNNNIENKLKIEVVDFNNETYSIVNNSTIELDAGNYSDSLNLLDETKFGTIIRKQGFIKLSNKSTTPIEVKTLIAGNEFNSNNAPKYYNVPMKTPDTTIQRSKQILYFRNIDITGQTDDIFRLVKERLSNTDVAPNPIYLDTTAIDSTKNIVFYNVDTQTFSTGKLLPNAGNDFICFTTEHPLYNPDDMQPLLAEFERITTYTANLKATTYQDEANNNVTGFAENDMYAIGENSCGAFLYPVVSNPVAISVVGSNTISTLVIPENSEILVPFVYEYRMSDRLGKINGSNDLTRNDTVTYAKKIGIDIMINQDTFRFDINVTSKLRATIAPIDSMNVSSIAGRFGAEERNTIS